MASVEDIFSGGHAAARAKARRGLRRLALVGALLLGGCADASLTYARWDGQAPIQSTSMKFALQQSTVTLQAASSNQAGAEARGGQDPISCVEATWGTCFKGVSAQAAPSAPEVVDMPEDWQATWVATPGSADLLATTAISGTTITGQDALYSVVTIKVTSKTASVVTGAGTGAAAGFGIGGPYGAVAGGVLGAGGALLGSTSTAAGVVARSAPTGPLKDYLCPDDKVDLSTIPATLAPQIQFPVTVKSAPDKLAPESEADGVTSVSKATPNVCWHALPNVAAVSNPTPLHADPAHPSPLIAGDGWLYRLVASDDLTKPPTGLKSQLATQFFHSKDPSTAQEFPYSACRKATLQILWWKELSDAVVKSENPKVLKFSVNLADPRYVYSAKVKKGGVVNFKTDCGASVSITPDTSAGPILNAVVTQGEGVLKAEQTWAASVKK